MNKGLLNKSLDVLKKYLGSEGDLIAAFQTIQASIDQFPEEIAEPLPEGFPIPSEIAGKPFAYALFCDGGCKGNPGPGAYGAMAQNSAGEVIFEKTDFAIETTNNKMELSGALEGLKELNFLLIERFIMPDEVEVYVYTDSKYVVDGMTSWVDGWKARGWKKADGKVPENLDLWQQLEVYREKYKTLKFQWVKGHAGHPQNEFCDKLANTTLKSMGHY